MNTTQAIPFPDKKYDIIYADPAWDYGSGELIGQSGVSSQVKNHYQVTSFEMLSKFPISGICNVDCLLFLWVISPELDRCIQVGKAWGFKFKTVAFVWDKQLNIPSHYTVSQCEICLVFKRGKIPQPRGKRNIHQFLSCQRGGHSVKPLQIKHRITEMFPTQAKIELFARPLPMFKGLEDGWDAWGNEA